MKTISFIVLLLTISREFSCASPEAGAIVGWGDNALYGCDGIPFSQFSTNVANVVTVAGQILTNAVAISQRFALLSDGTVFGWGGNDGGGVLGYISGTEITNGLVRINGTILSNVVAITFGGLALKNDGTIVTWGAMNTNVAGLSNIVAINYGLALKSDGTIVAWGDSNHEKAAVPESISNVVAIAQPGWISSDLALKKDGTVVEWHGHGHEDQTPAGLSNVVAIAHAEAFNGGSHYLALKSDGTVFGWGANYSGQATGIPTKTNDRTASGLVTLNGQVLSNVVAIAAGSEFSLALKSDGTIATWGFSPDHRLDAPAGLSNVVAIAVGPDYCLAITTNAAVAEKFRH